MVLLDTHLDLLTFWLSPRHLEDVFMTCLQDVFSVTIFRFLRRLQNVLRDVYKTIWKMKNCYAEGVLKTSSRHVLKTF